MATLRSRIIISTMFIIFLIITGSYLVIQDIQRGIIEVSPPFGIPPVVVSKDIDPFLEERLKDIFLKMDKDEEGKIILSKIMIDKFVNINDNAYDSIREMRKKVQ
ncbi:MAG: PhnD/SsuA/transferrin family substrate-binding protein [Candidatus Methanoperedens sp.]|nr:PhnD/SsuA/transferrin family substrate-binding protein [Candidatus Methanoperedens sp.]